MPTPPDACRFCGTALQHCLEMRNGPSVSECGTYCCAPCAENVDAHYTPETEQERRARHLTPGAHRTAAEPPPMLREYAVRNASGDVFPCPTRRYAEFLADAQPEITAVSRTVSAWQDLRP